MSSLIAADEVFFACKHVHDCEHTPHSLRASRSLGWLLFLWTLTAVDRELELGMKGSSGIHSNLTITIIMMDIHSLGWMDGWIPMKNTLQGFPASQTHVWYDYAIDRCACQASLKVGCCLQ
mmetsp:Transcript_17662/g.24241  ORF Transcript_17662/g.24241 Transcript_17662/m.24241 type:complete len:121 (+) Transcript_17662:345-707(+)